MCRGYGGTLHGIKLVICNKAILFVLFRNVPRFAKYLAKGEHPLPVNPESIILQINFENKDCATQLDISICKIFTDHRSSTG